MTRSRQLPDPQKFNPCPWKLVSNQGFCLVTNANMKIEVESKHTLRRAMGAVLTLAVLIWVWWAVAVLGNIPRYLLPTPLDVAVRWWSTLVGDTPLPLGET